MGIRAAGAANKLASVVVENVRVEAARQLLTVQDLVMLTGIKRNRLYKLFRGKSKLDLYDLAAFSEALHVSITSLITKR